MNASRNVLIQERDQLKQHIEASSAAMRRLLLHWPISIGASLTCCSSDGIAERVRFHCRRFSRKRWFRRPVLRWG